MQNKKELAFTASCHVPITTDWIVPIPITDKSQVLVGVCGFCWPMEERLNVTESISLFTPYNFFFIFNRISNVQHQFRQVNVSWHDILYLNTISP